MSAEEPTVVTTGSKGRHSTGAPFCFAIATLASKIVGDRGTSPEATKFINAAGAISWTLTSCSAILSKYSRPMDSSTLPIQRTPVVVLVIAILPFHLGSIKPLKFRGAAAEETSAVLNPRLL